MIDFSDGLSLDEMEALVDMLEAAGVKFGKVTFPNEPRAPRIGLEIEEVTEYLNELADHPLQSVRDYANFTAPRSFVWPGMPGWNADKAVLLSQLASSRSVIIARLTGRRMKLGMLTAVNPDFKQAAGWLLNERPQQRASLPYVLNLDISEATMADAAIEHIEDRVATLERRDRVQKFDF